MSNAIKTFTFPVTNANVRTYSDEKGNLWFVARDVLDILGFRLKTDAGNTLAATSYLRYLGEDEKVTVTKRSVESNDQIIAHLFDYKSYQTTLISESGLYKLVMRSDKPEAKQFQEWVTRDVLPAIRKDGGYIMGEEKVVTGEMTEDELLLKAMTILTTKVQRLTSERDALQSKVTEHLDFLTVDEWRALNHLYLTHGQKVRLGLKAKNLAEFNDIPYSKQTRKITVLSRTTGRYEQRETSVNVFPAHVLDRAANLLGYNHKEVA